ncbi:MAG: hypothetical protein AB1807_11835 [Pseudomonadota bacterium]
MIDLTHGQLVDLFDDFQPEPSDLEIVTAVSEAFDMPLGAVIERLICVDFVGVRKQVTP